MNRRRFAFWLSLGIFTLAERLRADGLDRLAAATLRHVAPNPDSLAEAVHWRATDNATWSWYERESLIDGQWVVTGITTPVHKRTGQRYTGHAGYLDDNLVPAEVRGGGQASESLTADEAEVESGEHRPDPSRRARHGRPPSVWLRSLHAEEIHIWLKTIEVPEADVSGMTFFEHLTRDHSFDPLKIEGLTIPDQAKLHAAAHHGY